MGVRITFVVTPFAFGRIYSSGAPSRCGTSQAANWLGHKLRRCQVQRRTFDRLGENPVGPSWVSTLKQQIARMASLHEPGIHLLFRLVACQTPGTKQDPFFVLP